MWDSAVMDLGMWDPLYITKNIVVVTINYLLNNK